MKPIMSQLITILSSLTLITTAAIAQSDVLNQAAKEPGAMVTPSGLVYRVITEGKGVNPRATDQVGTIYSRETQFC